MIIFDSKTLSSKIFAPNSQIDERSTINQQSYFAGKQFATF